MAAPDWLLIFSEKVIAIGIDINVWLNGLPELMVTQNYLQGLDKLEFQGKWR
ncbi:MAG: hypothetical protein KAJ65_01250 [Gammaproteobacteria bacterium]|nr:hypothetical protein [Gammaproteobacteria bacterium]